MIDRTKKPKMDITIKNELNSILEERKLKIPTFFTMKKGAYVLLFTKMMNRRT